MSSASAVDNFGTPYVPSTTRTATTENFVSSLDIYKPSISENLGIIYGSQQMGTLLEVMGAKRPVDQPEFKHYLEDRLHSKLVITSAATPSAANFAALTLTVADSKVTRVNDTVWLTGNQRAKVTEIVSGTSIKVVPFKAWASGVAINGDAAIYGNIWEEGTSNPDSMLNDVLEYTNSVQIIKEYFEETGSSMTNRIWFEVEGGFAYGLKGEKDTARRFVNYLEMTGILGTKKASGNTSLGDVSGSEGLYDFCKKGITVSTTANLGNFDRDSLNSYLKAHNRLRGELDLMIHAGYDVKAKFTEMLKDEFAATAQGVQFANFNGGMTAEQGIALGFDTYRYQGYTLRIRLYDPFSDPTTFGAGNLNFSQKALVTPVGETLDSVTRQSIPRMSIRYKDLGMGYSREYRTWMIGSQGVPVPTTSQDIRGVNYLSERGWEFVGANNFGLIEAA